MRLVTHMVERHCSVVWIATVVLSGAAPGNNNFFLPGDAFFPTTLTAEQVAGLKADRANPTVFEYSSLGGYEDAFCGFAGYPRANFPQLDDAFVANLKRVYARLREYEPRQLTEIERDGEKKLVETNPMRVLFYRRDFEFPKYRLGLQYNENWTAETMKFGHPPRQFRLCCLVNDADAVMECWRDANVVPGLEATLSDFELKPGWETTIEPVIIRGPTKAIVVETRPLAEYFRRHEMATLWIVDSSGIVEMWYEDGKWVTETDGE
ncbi:MAG TPA: hypothetical protein VGK58_08930 [Lacipirellulaceae bacterium]